MPIPGSVLGSFTPFGVASVTAVYQSRAVLMPLTKTIDTTGQEIHTFAASIDPSQFDIPCRRSPLIQIRPQSQELMTGNIQRYVAKFQVNFPVFLDIEASILSTWQISIDGSVFQILGVESDGGGLTTRLIISDAIPFNA